MAQTRQTKDDWGQAISLLRDILSDTTGKVGKLDKDVAVLEVRLTTLCNLVDSLNNDMNTAKEKCDDLDKLLGDMKSEALIHQTRSSNKTKVIVAALGSGGAVIGSVLTIIGGYILR